MSVSINKDVSSRLLDSVKLRLRISDPIYDDEIKALITSALVDMETSGVNTNVSGDEFALITQAIVIYAKAHFGLDNADRESYEASYQKIVAHMRNNPTDFRQGENS